jgi:hypothetical protein
MMLDATMGRDLDGIEFKPALAAIAAEQFGAQPETG